MMRYWYSYFVIHPISIIWMSFSHYACVVFLHLGIINDHSGIGVLIFHFQTIFSSSLLSYSWLTTTAQFNACHPPVTVSGRRRICSNWWQIDNPCIYPSYYGCEIVKWLTFHQIVLNSDQVFSIEKYKSILEDDDY